jgi:nitrogen regulatory protein PII
VVWGHFKISNKRRRYNGMKLIKAYIRTFMVDDVICALKQIGAPRLTAIDVRALGDEVASE